MKHFGDIMFTNGVRAEQEQRGSRKAYAQMTAQPAPEALGAREEAFIEARDSFYLASVNEEGWPYIQHRGGPKGFLKVTGPRQLAMADYRGNRQYVSTGNIKHDERVSLFLMDYPNKARLKILARAKIVDLDSDPSLAAKLADPEGGKVEQLMTFEVEAFDWNCPQFITPRFTADDIRETLGPKLDELETLRAENGELRKKLAALMAE